MRARFAVPLIAATAAALLASVPAGAGNTGAARSADKAERVWVHDNFFDRRSIEVVQEGKVVWVWKGENRHNVRFTKVPEGASRHGSRTQYEGRWRRSFRVQGVYRYVCKLYAGMRGTITVKPGKGEKSSAANGRHLAPAGPQ